MILKSLNDINIESMEMNQETILSEGKIKPFNQIKKGDILVVDNKEKAEVIATGTLKSLLKYDDSGATHDALTAGELLGSEKAVAIILQDTEEKAVYPYQELSTIFKGMESMENEKELEEAKKVKESEHEKKMDEEGEEETPKAESKKSVKETSKKSKTESEHDKKMDEEEDEEMTEAKKAKTESEDEKKMDEEEEEEVTEAKKVKESEHDKKMDEEEEDEEEVKEASDKSAEVSKKIVEKVIPETKVESEMTIEQLIGSDDSLTEEFKTKASAIFEAAVSEKVESLKEEFEARIQEEIKSHQDLVVEKVDGYLTYAIENVIEKNEESVDSKLRSEIAESFISSLKDVFEKHYIEMPESKVNVFEEVSKKTTDLEEKCAQQKSDIASLVKELTALKRQKIINEAADDLYDTQAERLNKLTENLEFVDEESFAKKVQIIKETYFKNGHHGKSEDEEISESSDSIVRTRTIEEEVPSEINSVMGKYVEAIAKHMKKN